MHDFQTSLRLTDIVDFQGEGGPVLWTGGLRETPSTKSTERHLVGGLPLPEPQRVEMKRIEFTVVDDQEFWFEDGAQSK